MTTRADIDRQIAAIRGQAATITGWPLDSGPLTVARCDTLVLLSERLREMVLDFAANQPKKRLPQKLDAGKVFRN